MYKNVFVFVICHFDNRTLQYYLQFKGQKAVSCNNNYTCNTDMKLLLKLVVTGLISFKNP